MNSIGEIFKDRNLIMPDASIYEEKETSKPESDNATSNLRS